MGRLVDMYEADNGEGYAEIRFSSIEETFYIHYYDDNKRLFFTENFENKSIRQVRSKAHDWSIGKRKLEDI